MKIILFKANSDSDLSYINTLSALKTTLNIDNINIEIIPLIYLVQ